MHSPLKDPRTRYPGQSLSEQISDISLDQSAEILMPALVWLIAMLEWLRYSIPAKPSPWLWTFMALIATWFCVRRIRTMAKRKKNLRKGMVGEQILGKYLEEQLMPDKYHILHDLIGKNGEKTFNIDHVIVGPTGIFSVETKNWTNPDGTHHQIYYDGKQILVDGRHPDKDPLTQGIAGGKWVSDILETLTGKHFFVQPIVVFLGSYTTKNPGNAPAWVLNEQAVPSFIRHNFSELSHDDVGLVTAQLKKYSEDCDKKAGAGYCAEAAT